MFEILTKHVSWFRFLSCWRAGLDPVYVDLICSLDFRRFAKCRHTPKNGSLMRIRIKHFQKIKDTDPESEVQKAAFCEKYVKSSLHLKRSKVNVNTFIRIHQRCGSRSGSASQFRSSANQACDSVKSNQKPPCDKLILPHFHGNQWEVGSGEHRPITSTVPGVQEEEAGPTKRAVYTGRRVKRVILVLDCLSPHDFSSQVQQCPAFLYIWITELLIFKSRGTFLQCCVLGSGRIGVILVDPVPDRHLGPTDPEPDLDPDPYSFQPYIKLNYSFSRKFIYTVQTSENYDTDDDIEKNKTV